MIDEDAVEATAEAIADALRKEVSRRRDADERTFVCGDHDRVVKRPPRRDVANDDTDPAQHDAVERWECLDCGVSVQGRRVVGVCLSNRSCPPEVTP